MLPGVTLRALLAWAQRLLILIGAFLPIRLVRALNSKTAHSRKSHSSQVWSVPQKCVPAIVKGVGHKAVEAIYTAWRTTLKGYVRHVQTGTTFGTSSPSLLDEVEVDETVVRKQHLANHQVQWQEAVALKRRGDRKSLVVLKRPAAANSAVVSRGSNCRGVQSNASAPALQSWWILGPRVAPRSQAQRPMMAISGAALPIMCLSLALRRASSRRGWPRPGSRALRR